MIVVESVLSGFHCYNCWKYRYKLKLSESVFQNLGGFYLNGCLYFTLMTHFPLSSLRGDERKEKEKEEEKEKRVEVYIDIYIYIYIYISISVAYKHVRSLPMRKKE